MLHLVHPTCVRVCLQARVLAFMCKKYAHPQGQEKAKERSFGATIAICSIIVFINIHYMYIFIITLSLQYFLKYVVEV